MSTYIQRVEPGSVSIVLTTRHLCELLSKATGQNITEATHWVTASIEMPPELPPLGITITAKARSQ